MLFALLTMPLVRYRYDVKNKKVGRKRVRVFKDGGISLCDGVQ
jgi:hypothetical protein